MLTPNLSRQTILTAGNSCANVRRPSVPGRGQLCVEVSELCSSGWGACCLPWRFSPWPGRPGWSRRRRWTSTRTTVYEGEAAKIDTATGAFDKKPAYAITRTKADSEKSSDDDVLFVETSCAVFDTGGARECVNGNDPDLITASIDIFATDRETALAVDDKNLPDDAVPHEGLINKFPFDVEKKTYPFWDGTIGRAVDIEYDGTETLSGSRPTEFTYTVDRRADRDRRGRRRHLRQHGHGLRRPEDGVDRQVRPGPAAVPRRRHAGAGHPGHRHRRHGQGRRRRGRDQRQDRSTCCSPSPDRRLRRRRPLPARRLSCCCATQPASGQRVAERKEKVGAGA